eukprot:TRINITY_DN2238_c1_g1_i7.p1 TRINITY_DN2238_c1_g1~~TRINITY_DN2238_c1_g1_i7.p1  ORF type:complete len:237 (+),score=60.77 TRINITY_DN2238_c1_g1_i7:105-815(+)
MKIFLVLDFTEYFEIDTLPSDTLWALKWKVYSNECIRNKFKSEGNEILSPDDQMLWLPDGEEMIDSERSLESYSIHEGSEITCHPHMKRKAEQMSFKKLLNVFRKKKAEVNELELEGMIPLSLVKHASAHFHEIHFIRLGRQEDGEIRPRVMDIIGYMARSIPSLIALDISNTPEIGSDGFIRTAEYLESNKTLKELIMSGSYSILTSFLHISLDSYTFNHSFYEYPIMVGHMVFF